jgi:hypothetical protein
LEKVNSVELGVFKRFVGKYGYAGVVRMGVVREYANVAIVFEKTEVRCG